MATRLQAPLVCATEDDMKSQEAFTAFLQRTIVDFRAKGILLFKVRNESTMFPASKDEGMR